MRGEAWSAWARSTKTPIDEVYRRMDRRYFPGQARYRAAFDPIARADVLIDNSDWSRPRVVRLATERFPAPVAAALARCLRGEF